MNSITKLWSLLDAKERRHAYGLLGLMAVSMVLEMLGLGIVVPGLSLMVSDQAPALPATVSSWLAWLGSPSRERLLLAGLVALLGFYVFKAMFVLAVTWRQLRFVAAVQNRIARTLFASYLTQPWTYHLGRNSAEMIRNINDIAPLAATGAAFLGAMAELLIVCGVLAVLIVVEPLGALVVASLLGMATWLLDWISRGRLARWGKLAQFHQGKMFQHLYQGLGGVKEVKVLGCEQAFIGHYATHRFGFVRYASRQALFSQLPRLWFELLAMAALCLLGGLMAWQGRSTTTMIPTLGLFAAAAFRLLPSINRLALAAQSLRYTQASLDTIHDEIGLLPSAIPVSSGRVPFAREIVLDGVSFRYPGSRVAAIEDVSITIPHGSAVGIIGGSGAGKSTLVDIILGLLRPERGSVEVDGVPIDGQIRAWQDTIGYVPQTIYLCDDTLRRNVAFGIPDEDIDDESVRRALYAAQLEAFVAQLPDGVDTMVGEQGVRLSGGQRQRIAIARAMYRDPDILILDEASSALDTATEQGLMHAVNALHGQKTLIIVAHRLTTIANCDHVYRLDHGKVTMAGSYAEVIGS